MSAKPGVLADELKTVWPSLVSLQIGHVASLVLGAATVAALSRALGPEGYGVLTLFSATAQYAVLVAVSWTSASLIRFGKDEFVKTASVTETFWSRLALLAPCVAIALMAVAAWVAFEPPPLVGRGTYVVALVMMILALTAADHLDGTLQAAGRWRVFAWQGAIEKLAALAILGGIVLVTRPSAANALALVIVAQVVRLAASGTAVVRQRLVLGVAIRRARINALVGYSWPLLATFTVGYFSAFVEPFLIRRYLDVAAVGTYQVAFQVNLFALALMSPVATLLFPAYTSLRVQNRLDLTVRVAHRLIPQFVFIACMALPLSMAIAELSFERVFGARYLGGLQPLLILLATLGFQSIAVVYSPMLAAHDLTRESALLNTVGGVFLHLLPQLLLIPLFGLNGAAASWLIWYVCSATVCVWVMSRRLNASFFTVLQYPAVAFAGLAIVMLCESQLVQTSLLLLLMGAAFAWATSRGLFHRDDLAIFDAIGLSPAARRVIGLVYGTLSPRV